MRILVVEDDAELGESLAEFFGTHGHQVAVGTNALHGLRLAGTFRPHLVLIDIALPIFDGNLVAAELRKRETEPPRLVAMTGRKGAVLPSLFDGILAKPMYPADLVRLLEECGPRRRRRTSAAHVVRDDEAEDTSA